MVFELPNEGNEKPIAKSELAFMKSLREELFFILVIILLSLLTAIALEEFYSKQGNEILNGQNRHQL